MWENQIQTQVAYSSLVMVSLLPSIPGQPEAWPPSGNRLDLSITEKNDIIPAEFQAHAYQQQSPLLLWFDWALFPASWCCLLHCCLVGSIIAQSVLNKWYICQMQPLYQESVPTVWYRFFISSWSNSLLLWYMKVLHYFQTCHWTLSEASSIRSTLPHPVL